ncbi:MAG: hypothetical protein ACJA0Q_000787 [Saprospiraceae bacterium]|jgi:hypothetical protein
MGVMAKIARDCFRVDNYNYPKADVLTIAHDIDRNFKYGSKYYSPLIDTIEDQIKLNGVKTISFARIISTLKGDISHGNAYSPEGGFARAMLLKRFKGVFLKGKYPYSHYEERIWGKILDKTGAKKIIGIQPSRELCIACKKRGVWVADVQHGNISEGHKWYGISFRGDQPKEWLPDDFLVWDNASAGVLEWVKEKGSNCTVIGNRWLIRFVKNDENDPIVKYAQEASKWNTIVDNGKKNILVTMQWGQQNDPLLVGGYISKELEKVILSTSDKYNWCLRLHPNQLNGFSVEEGERFVNYYKTILKGHAEYLETTAAPLPLVLRGCSLHITWFSSTVHETNLIGMNSALLDPECFPGGKRSKVYEHLLAEGRTFLVKNEKANIITWIDNNIAQHEQSQLSQTTEENYEKLIQFLSN